jgi:arginyl-tRNA synthetase
MSEQTDKREPKLLEDMLSAWLKAGFEKAFSGTGQSFENIAAVATSSPEFGDYQCNAAMGLAKALKKAPFDIARTAVDAFAPHEAVEKAEVVKPGFINLHLQADWLAGRVEEMAGDGRLGVPQLGKDRTVVIDYSSPNVAKPMHIGHIRSTIIGNSIDRMHRHLGYRVISDNHIGDWGTQFGILIMGYRNFVDRDALARAPIEELERLYVKSYEQTKADETWLARCRNELVKLQSGDAENLALWREFVRLSLDEFARIYDRLGVSFDHVRGESHYRDKLKGVVELLEKKGLAVPSEGAKVVFLEEEKLPPAIVRKSDGAFNYTTTDVATVLTRVEEFGPERIIYVTDERQQLHFRQIFALCRRLGVSAGLEHVWFGLMRLPEGTFSTREGNVIRLERLLDEAESRALKIVEESSPSLTPVQQKEIARAVGIGAVKYADLSQNPQTTVTFTWDKALALDGNSGPYLQYACARIASVRDKYVERFPGCNPDASPIRFTEPVERLLALKLARFPETLARAARGYKPSVLTDYLYDLAQAYSTFYQNVPFLKAPEGVRESRVRLCGVVAQVLGTGLNLLGIDTPPRI